MGAVIGFIFVVMIRYTEDWTPKDKWIGWSILLLTMALTWIGYKKWYEPKDSDKA